MSHAGPVPTPSAIICGTPIRRWSLVVPFPSPLPVFVPPLVPVLVTAQSMGAPRYLLSRPLSRSPPSFLSVFAQASVLWDCSCAFSNLAPIGGGPSACLPSLAPFLMQNALGRFAQPGPCAWLTEPGPGQRHGVRVPFLHCLPIRIPPDRRRLHASEPPLRLLPALFL